MKQKIYLVTETYTKNGVKQYYNAPEVWAETREKAEEHLKRTADFKMTWYPETRMLGQDENHLMLRYTDDEGNDCIEFHFIHEVTQYK